MIGRLDRLLRRGLAWRIFYVATEGLSRASGFFLAGAGLLFLAELLHPSAAEFRRIAAVLSLAAAAALAALNAGRPGLSRRSVASALGGAFRPPDRLLNLWELLREKPGGNAFTERESAAVGAGLAGLRPSLLLRPNRWGKSLLAALAFWSAAGAGALLLPAGARNAFHRVLWPWGAEDAWLVLSPGDRRVPAGENVTVTARPRFPSKESPALFVREESGAWENRPLTPAPDGAYRCVLERVSAPLLYRARAGGIWTRTFRLTPYSPPRFERLHLRVRPPAYTGLPAEEWADVLSLRAPAGSILEGEGRLDSPVRAARLATETGAEVPLSLTDGRDLRFKAPVRRGGTWIFRFAAREGEETEVPLSIEAIPDEPPVIRLLSPEGDVALESRERLAVVYEASDDHGLAQVSLVLRRDGGTEERRPLSAAPGIREEALTAERLGLSPDGRVSVWLEAEDANPSGPGRSRTPPFTVTTVSREADRRRREEDLDRLREALLAAKTDEELVRGKLSAAGPPWNDLVSRQRMAEEGLRELTERLESISASMASDPAADPWLAAEARAAAADLRGLLAGALPRASEALRNSQKKDAAESLDEIVKELDRAAAATEEALKSARARALGRQEGLEDASRELAEGVENALSPEERRKMDAVMREIAEGLRAVAEALQKTPGFLPDVPPGADPGSVLKMSDMLRDLSDAKDAMERGDAAGARRAAQSLLEKVRQMRKIMAEGGLRVGGEKGLPRAIEEEWNRAAESVREVVRRQEALKARIQGLRDNAALRLKAAQEAVLRSTVPVPSPVLSWTETDAASMSAGAGEQDSLRGSLGGVRALLEEVRRKTSLLPARVLQRIDGAARAMEGSAADLRGVRPAESVAAQEEALRLLRENDPDMSSPGGAGGGASPGGGKSFPSGLPFPGGARPLGPTRLPRAEDYRPPREFREELLKALQEKYPRRDEGLIGDYFKRWKK